MTLPTFKKGIHPEDTKFYSNKKAIEPMALPDEVFIPLQQHIGAPCNPLVQKGDRVKTGQIIGRAEAFVSAPVHSSVTGIVKTIDKFAHPLGSRITMIHIQRDGDDEWELMPVYPDWKIIPVEKLLENIKNAGIVGMGGAGFPTHVKLSPPKNKPINAFILNGVECEPFLTADHRTMLEYADQVLEGMAIMLHILDVGLGYIGIENNKPDAIELLTRRIAEKGYPFKVVPLALKYPQGAEKMLIQSVLKRQVPTGGLPMDVGVVVNNVGTAMAVYQAVVQGKSLVERVVTVTGNGIQDPKNVLTRIGTPFKSLVNFCGGIKETLTQVFMGGPMMGITQYNLDIPVVKTTSGIICSSDNSVQKTESYACIHCGSCVSACPMFLMPTRIARYSELRRWDDAAQFGIMNCIECGSCAFVCPSNIPLVQWIRVGKFKVAEKNRKSAS